MDATIKSTIERTRQYWYIDGFSEVLTGLIFLLLGTINVFSGIYPPSLGSAVTVGVGYPLVILVGTFGGRKWVKSLKEKITFPRTGYVKYIQPERSSRAKRIVTVFFVAIMVSIITMVISRDLDPFWVVFGTGLIIAAFIAYMAIQIPLNRFILLAIWVVIVSLISAKALVPEDIQMGILLVGSGIGWLVSGGLTLLRYMKETKPASQEMDE
jgi:hypothetical protein